MADLTPELAPQVVAACGENAEEAAGAIGRAFEGEFVLKAGEPGPRSGLDADAIAGGGLVLALQFGEEQMLATLSAGEGLVPEWTRSPDPTGVSKLSTLAQELSMLLVPDTLMADVFEAFWVDDLAAAVERSGAEEEATTLSIEVAGGEKLAQLTLFWPVANALAAKDPDSAEAPSEAPAESTAGGAAAEEATDSPADAVPNDGQARVLRWSGTPPRDFRDLPPNAVSVLRVAVPVSACLAAKKLPLSDVVELGPGSIIMFDNACDDPLEVLIGEHRIATGEAVKVGERFGIRVTEMILPEEHFRPMLPPRAD